MPKKICSRCGKLVDYDHKCYKDTRKKDINSGSGSNEWRKLRQAVKERDLCCKLCWSKGVYSPAEECHHIVPREYCEEDQVFDAANCIMLCIECHHQIHNDGWQKYVKVLRSLLTNED